MISSFLLYDEHAEESICMFIFFLNAAIAKLTSLRSWFRPYLSNTVKDRNNFEEVKGCSFPMDGMGQRVRTQITRLNSILQDRSSCHFTALWHSRDNTPAPDGKQRACWPDSRSIYIFFCSGSSSRARIVLYRPPHWSLYQT